MGTIQHKIDCMSERTVDYIQGKHDTMLQQVSNSNSNPHAAALDGVSEGTVNGVHVQCVEPQILDGIKQLDYTWCNTNKGDTETYNKLRQRDDGDSYWYQKIMAEIQMEKWTSILGDLTRKPQHILIITASQQNKYFKPAAQLAKQGV